MQEMLKVREKGEEVKVEVLLEEEHQLLELEGVILNVNDCQWEHNK